MEKLYKSLGNICYSFGKIHFLISNISVQLGLTNSYQQFYALTNFEKKIKNLRETAIKAIVDQSVSSELITILDKLEELRTIRNKFVHSIIQTNVSDHDQFVFYNFINKADKIETQISHYSINDIEKLNNDFIQVYNDIYSVSEKLNLISD